MSSIHTLIDLFAATPTLSNAKKLVAKTIHNPMSVTLVLADGIAHIENARRVIADAQDPTKTKEAMQRELQARYKGMNITVI